MSTETALVSATAAGDELRVVPLSAIDVREGFNPREHFDTHELERLTASIRRHGVLQPLLVRPGSKPGSFELTAGERRYRAAFAAGLTEVPVLVRTGSDADESAGLVAAVVENIHRSVPTPVEEAHAYQRLLDGGLSRKGVCEQLCVPVARVRERLALLKIPSELHGAIDAGEIPLSAVPALIALAKIHHGLPACALARVREQPEASWMQPLTWGDVIADPIGSVTCRHHGDTPQLPDGVYEDSACYLLAAFALSEKATRDLERLAELDDAWAGEGPEMMITWEMVEHAERLHAAYRSEHSRAALVVGADVAGELVAGLIARRLKDERARVRREQERQESSLANSGGHGVPGEPAASAEDLARSEAKRRRAEREAQQQAKRDTEVYNDRLGSAVFKALSTVKVDARVVRVLAAVDLHGELEGIAMRGARYGFPGWVTEHTTKTGKAKRIYVERPDALSKAREYLAGAQSAGQIAGRCLALIAMAVLADEECAARSSRAGYSMHTYRRSLHAIDGYGSRGGLQWTQDVAGLVEEICLEQLPAAATDRLRERRERDQQEHAERDRETQAATAAYTALASRLGGLGAQEREQALAAYEREHPTGDFELEQLQEQHEQPGSGGADTEQNPASREADGDRVGEEDVAQAV